MRNEFLTIPRIGTQTKEGTLGILQSAPWPCEVMHNTDLDKVASLKFLEDSVLELKLTKSIIHVTVGNLASYGV